MRALAGSIVLAVALFGLSACGTRAASYVFETHACPAEFEALGAQCGTVSVPENYDAPEARSIALNVVILRASNSNPTHDPLFELEGGPGVAVTTNVSFYATDGAMYHRDRDLVFVDMRGTGGSNPLNCASLESYAQNDPSGPLFPSDMVEECAASLSARADLRQYTTANAARDLDAVRQALGVERIALDALSYGTTLALAYMADYPEHVSAAVLTSTVPAQRTPPRFHASAVSDAFAQLTAACAADDACASRFPDPLGDLNRARRRFATPEQAEIFTERVRSMMYSPAGARRVPLFLSQSARGVVNSRQGGAPGITDGLYLSITCAESFPFFDVEAARAEARATAFGDYRLRRQSAACAVWPTTPSRTPRPERVVDVPVLFVSGEFDPVSPAAWTEEVLPLFPNARHIVIAGGGHIVDGLSNLDTCYDPLIVHFFDTRDAANLDTTCLADVRPPAFVLE